MNVRQYYPWLGTVAATLYISGFSFSLVFSQSLLSLDLIEKFLVHWDETGPQEDEKDEESKVRNIYGDVVGGGAMT